MKPIHFKVVIKFERGDDKVLHNVAYDDLPEQLNNFLVAGHIMGSRVVGVSVEALTADIIKMKRKPPLSVVPD